MKKIILFSFLFLTGCAGNLMYAPAPKEPISIQESAVATGILKSRGLSFTLISHYHNGGSRILILAEPMFKLIDMDVSKEKIQIYYKEPRLGNAQVKYFACLAQKYFMTPCPSRHIIDGKGSKNRVELNVTGGICP